MAAQAPNAEQEFVGMISWPKDARRNPTPLEIRAADVIAAELEAAFAKQPNPETEEALHEQWRLRFIRRLHSYVVEFAALLHLPFVRPLISDLLFHYIRSYNERKPPLTWPITHVSHPKNQPDDHGFLVELESQPPKHDPWYTQWWLPTALRGMHFLFGYMCSPFI